MSRVYELILDFDYSKLDVEKCLENWLPLDEAEKLGAEAFAATRFPKLGVVSVRAKFADRETTRARLENFKSRWPEIRARLAGQLVPSAEIKCRLEGGGAATSPEAIGSTVEATLSDVRKTIFMRDRYMALDFLALTGQLDEFAAKALSGK